MIRKASFNPMPYLDISMGKDAIRLKCYANGRVKCTSADTNSRDTTTAEFKEAADAIANFLKED